MAILKYFNGGHYHDANSRQDVIHYVFSPDKIPDRFVGYVNVDPHDISGSMQQVAAAYNKDSGVRIRHMALNFSPDELSDAKTANAIAAAIANHIGNDFQTVYAVHQDTDHLNVHFVHNAVSFVDGHRYKGRKSEYRPVEQYMRSVLRDYGIYQFHSCSRQSGLNGGSDPE